MGIAQIQVNEYTCELCDYKWVNRVNGKDGPIPKRCAKCKHQHWEKGHINSYEKAWRDAVKKRFGYFSYPGGMFHGGWRVEENVKNYLECRPSVDEMRLLLKPMCYHYTTVMKIALVSKSYQDDTELWLTTGALRSSDS